MSFQVLLSLSTAVAAVEPLPLPAGLGAADVLTSQVHAIAAAVTVLQRELAVRMAALEAQGPPPSDVRGEAVLAGLASDQAARLRRLGVFVAEHPDVQEEWRSQRIGDDQVLALRAGAARLATPALRAQLVAVVLPHLPALDGRQARRLVGHAVDHLQPGDPDSGEQSDHAARRLVWSRTPRGGIVLEGYLPAPEAHLFMAAIGALVCDLRAAGDGLSGPQRRADALAALVERADLPTGGGLPPAMTLTVSLDEAARVALRDPATFGTEFTPRPRGGSLVGDVPAGDAAVRFGVCCGSVTPLLHDGPTPAGLLGRIASTRLAPLAVGRSVRLATATQRTALQVRDGGCVIPGCAVAADHTQPHHVTPFALDGPTNLDNLVSLCHVHHRQVELGRYVFIRKQPGQPRPDGALGHALWWIIPPRPGVVD